MRKIISIYETLSADSTTTSRFIRQIFRMFSISARAGFTLIELLLVISIIGLLASIILLGLNKARSSARDSSRLASVKQIIRALELYNSTHNNYPSSGTPIGSGGDILPSGMVPTYMSSYPTAPTPADGSCTNSNNPYKYSYNSGIYKLTFCLGSQISEYKAGLRTASNGVIQ